MRRVVIILGLIAIGVLGVSMNTGREHKITISDASLSRMSDGSIMAAAVITNDGAPDALIGASALGFHHGHMMGGDGALVIPGGAAPILAGDGAHVMLQGNNDASVGEMVPLVLTFQNAGKVTTRARMAEATMDHAAMLGIEVDGIMIQLSVEGAGREGVTGTVDIEGLTIISRPNDAAHVDGEGHGHVYLNGLKLQRLYQPNFEIGSLLPGDYILSVSLNANDHRPYVQGGVPISSTIRFTVD